METSAERVPRYQIKKPSGLSARIKWLRDYYFQGANRNWNNESTSWTTGTEWDICYNEGTYYIVPENFALFDPVIRSYRQSARVVKLRPDFWELSIEERVAWFRKEVMVKYVPQEIHPGDLIAGARFNLQTSLCLNKTETEEYNKRIEGKNGSRQSVIWFHNHGYGNTGATMGHLIPGYEKPLKIGWKGIFAELEILYNKLDQTARNGSRGSQLRAMMEAARLPRELAYKYANFCTELSQKETDPVRRGELTDMSIILKKVPWEPATNFWEAVQSLWLTHMLVMSDENFPGPGISFGRIDQYLLPYWEKSLSMGMDREFGKEILKCFWMHCNTAYDSMIKTGNNGITAAFGQLISLSGCDRNGNDMTNDLTFAMLEVIDDMSPILEPKPSIRLHRNSPDQLIDKLIEMISTSQGAPFLLNFDERSMAGMMRESNMGNYQKLINHENVHEYASVGCLENTMVGNDRSGTVDSNLNLLKAVELALTGGKDLIEYVDPVSGKKDKITQDGPKTKPAEKLKTWDEFWSAYSKQTAYIIDKTAEVYEKSESLRKDYIPTPYLSCLVKGCAEKGMDITDGGAEISFTTLEGVTFATTVDSLLAIKYLVYDHKICSMKELVNALRNNWAGHEVLQAIAKNRAPKYGRDDDEADDLGRKVMDLWTNETWKHKTKSTNRQFRPGMLSWNYWAADGYLMAASANGRPRGQFLSNAICPSNGADINGPTSNSNSVGKVLGGKAVHGDGDWFDYNNSLPNGASHTITFNPALMRDTEHRDKFRAFIRGYIENGGTALQVNILDPEMLKDAQKNPQDYRHLLVRVTGYNAYFVTIGKELQNEVINRLSHNKF